MSAYVSPNNEYLWGLKLIADGEQVVFEQNWFEYNPKQEWKHYGVTVGNNVIGFYGDMD